MTVVLALLFMACSIAQPLPRKGLLGAQLLALSADAKSAAGVESGVLVGTVFPGTTAEAHGLKSGDVVVSIDGKPITTPAEGVAAANTVLVGLRFEMRIVRGRDPQTLSMTMQERPRDKGENYEVLYDHVVSNGRRIRTLISKPTGPGKRPVFFLIQGLGGFSLDNPIGTGAYAPLVKSFVDEGWVTVRVDKPGQGDSEGGPTADEGFDAELDCYRQALKAIKGYDFVDQDRIFIFGHSMGGCFGPIIASEEKVAGIAVYGTVVKTWLEYWLENVRRQQLLAGSTYADLHESMQSLGRFMHYLFKEKLGPDDIKKQHPDLTALTNSFFPNGVHMSTRVMDFWRELDAKNFASFWERVSANVLAMWAENEFIATREDHVMIADIVNSKRPGTAEFVVVKESDHGFFKTTSATDSHRKWGQPGGEFNPEVIRLLKEWIAKVEKPARSPRAQSQ